MYRTLFDLAGLAMLGWLLVILLPTWRATRRLAESAIFPAYLSILYVVGLLAVVRATGFGFMADFGSADGVLGLLAQEPIALVAWIHILAFDQVVGLLIYRDNMRHRFVPIPLQSVLLVATLMLGPVGFLTYWAVRAAKTRRAVAWDEPEPIVARPPREKAPVIAPRFGQLVGGLAPLTAISVLLGSHRAIFAGGGSAGRSV
jgi:hypothetical protein